MGNVPVPFGIDRSLPRLDGRDPYLSLHFVMIFVRDQERSLRFYLDQLGFRLLVDQTFENGGRWIEVGPPDGSANIALAQATPDSDAYKLIGRDSQIYFITEDVPAKYEEWSSRGVRFQFPPQVPAWGGIFSRFEDVDGNSFGLAGFDELTQGVERQRRTLNQKIESERRAAQELEIATQVQARLFPQVRPEAKTLEYAGLCIQARQVGGDYFDFLRSRQAPSRPGDRRRVGEGNCRRSSDGQPASELAQPMRCRLGSSGTAVAFGKRPVLREHD